MSSPQSGKGLIIAAVVIVIVFVIIMISLAASHVYDPLGFFVQKTVNTETETQTEINGGWTAIEWDNIPYNPSCETKGSSNIGKRTGTRSCTNPIPEYNGSPCSAIQFDPYNNQTSVVEETIVPKCGLTAWKNVGTCPETACSASGTITESETCVGSTACGNLTAGESKTRSVVCKTATCQTPVSFMNKDAKTYLNISGNTVNLGTDSSKQWEYHPTTMQYVNVNNGNCLTATKVANKSSSSLPRPTMTTCSILDSNQKWIYDTKNSLLKNKGTKYSDQRIKNSSNGLVIDSGAGTSKNYIFTETT
jgi:hypothetical protein